MQTATADWTEFAPPQPPGQLRALGLAVVAHLLLLGALTWGVTWKHQSDSTLSVQAELWSAVPQEAAPKLQTPLPVAPPPPPPAPKPVAAPRPAPPPPPALPDIAQRNADIALARQKKEAEALAARQKLEIEQKKQQQQQQQRQKLEKEKEEAQHRVLEQKRLAREQLEREKLKKAADEKKTQEKKLALDAQRKEAALKEAAKKKAEDTRAEAELKAEREANIARMKGMAGATGGKTATGNALQSSGPSAGYAGKVAATVRPKIVFTDDIAGNPTAEVEVRAAPDGTILSRKLAKSSGSKTWDEAVLKAIDKTDKLPLDTDGRVPPAMIIAFRPRD